jgi:hypothetical protein
MMTLFLEANQTIYLESLEHVIDRSKKVGDMTSLRSDLEKFAKKGNLQPSDVICGCRLSGNDHDMENPSSANNEEEEEHNLLLTILKIGLVNIMKVDPNDADIILKNFKSSGKKQQLVQSDKKVLIKPKDSDVQLSTDQSNDLRELTAKHYGKGPKNFQKELDKYAKQHNLSVLQFSEVDDDGTLSGSQPADIFNNGSQVTQENLNEDNNMLTEGQRDHRQVQIC